MKLLDMKGYYPTLIEDSAPFTVEISRYKKYDEAHPLKQGLKPIVGFVVGFII